MNWIKSRLALASPRRWAKLSLRDRFDIAMRRPWMCVDNQGGGDSFQKMRVRPAHIRVIRDTPAVIYLKVDGVQFEQAFTPYYEDQP
jgi:hypothetical protein